MEDSFDSTDRTPSEFFLFTLGFLGFVIGAAGVVLASLASALFGWLLLLLAVASFQLRPSPD